MAATLTDAQLDRWVEHLDGETAAQAIVDLLTLHRLIQDRVDGVLQQLVAFDAAAIVHVLARVAPGTFEDSLALLGEEAR